MKKVTLILISIIYIASIILISVFGMKSVLYITVVSVRDIVCLNQTDPENNIDVSYQNDIMVIKTPYVGPGNYDTSTASGTNILLFWRVYPDNASNKEIRFVYNRDIQNAYFFKINQTVDANGNVIDEESGTEIGLILFYGKVSFNVRIEAVDGSRVFAEIRIWVY